MQIHILYRKEFFIKAITYILVCSLLGILSMYVIKSKPLSILFLMVMIIPIPFLKLLLNIFRKKMHLQIFFDHLQILIENHKGYQTEKRIDFTDIKSYSVQFPSEKFSSIKFNLTTNKSLEYSFYNNAFSKEDIGVTELIDSVHESIKKYNRSESNKILFVPAFYATTKGLVLISSLIIFLLIGVFLYALYSSKSLPVTFIFSLILIGQLLLRRNKDFNYYKKTNTQD